MFSSHSGRKRHLFVLLATLAMIALVASTALAAPASRQEGPLDRLQVQSRGAVRVFSYPPTGVVRWIDAEYGVLTAEFSAQAGNPEGAARAFLASYGSLMGLQDQAGQLQLRSIKGDSLGMQHVRFDQVQNGVPVFGADVIVHFNAAGGITSANGYLAPDAPQINTTPKLSEKQAAELALKYAGLGDGYVSEASLTLLNPGLITERASQTFLTYRVHVDSASQPHLAQWVFVDAHSGELRFAYASHPETRTRNTYNMKHGTSYTSATLVRTEGSAPVTTATSCTVADINNAHDYAGNTYDFYYSRYGRDSYNNAGGALNSYVCYSSNYQNAFWDGSKMTYGNGFAAADDVVAHELSHGVTEYASGLVYSYQSGALNESYSDIFGEAVDLTNSGGTDTSAVRWDMGEDIPGIGAIRDMMDPTRFGDPDKSSSANMVCSSTDNGGVHTNSGVPNKAYALMVDGGSFNGYTVAAIGIDAASAVQYRTNEYKLTSSSKFYDNYLALLQSCADLYGAGSATCASVKNAAEAVEMHKAVCGSGGGPTATPAGTATPPAPTHTPTATSIPSTPTATPLPGACSTFTSSDVPKTISDLASATSTVGVSAGGAVSDVNLTIGSLTHTYDADLDIYLRHPDGTEVQLSDDNGGSGDHYTNTVFDDEATAAVTTGAAPFTGSFRPEALLSGFDGKAAAGTWTLRVYDDASADTGQLSAWSVTICTSGGATATPTSVPATPTPTRTATPTATPLPGACSTFTSSDVPKTISDLASATSTVGVSAGGAVSDVNLTIGSLTHTYDADLDIYLRHPDGTEVQLSDDNGGSGDHYTNTVFDDEATAAVTTGAAPFTGSFRPEALLSGFDGKAAAGTWTLRVYDDASADTGQLSAWSVTICTSGGATATPTSVPATPTPTRTATPTGVPATPTPTATAAPASAALLPLIARSSVPATAAPASALVNPGFELGRNVGWAESSARGYALVTSGAAHAGSWRAWLGGANSETAEISQSYSVPAGGGTLTYWYRITSTDSCGYDYGYVQVNTTTLKTYSLCSTSATSTYVQGSVSLAAYAGQTVSLKFRAVTDSSYSSSFYIDDVAVAASFQAAPDGGMEGEQLTPPQPKPAAASSASDER